MFRTLDLDEDSMAYFSLTFIKPYLNIPVGIACPTSWGRNPW